MKVIQYTVLDPLTMFSNALATMGLRSLWYARIGEHGLLEDYLISKGYIIDGLEEVEVPDDFIGFSVVQIDSAHFLDTSSGRIHLRNRAIEPSLN